MFKAEMAMQVVLEKNYGGRYKAIFVSGIAKAD
jgi:hypothetical protein